MTYVERWITLGKVEVEQEKKKGRAVLVLALVRVAPGGSIDDRWTTCGALERRGAVARAHEVPRSFGGELFCGVVFARGAMERPE